MPIVPLPGGVWSATPTPLTSSFQVDDVSVHRMVARHVEMGVKGIMLGGTCGEGPWLADRDRERLTRTTADAAAGRLHIALQVTDNSAARVLANIDRAAAWGAEIAMVAAPYVFLNATPQRLLAHFRDIARESCLTVGLYDGGEALAVPEPYLPELLAESKIAMVKDSSSLDSRLRAYVAAHRQRPEILLLNGDEFNCVRCLQAGYDGLLLGGAVFNGYLAASIIKAAQGGDWAGAEKLQARMNDLMYRVYGGPTIECWLSGLKEMLVALGVFSTRANLLGYPLTETCREQIHAALNGADGLGYRADLLGAAIGK